MVLRLARKSLVYSLIFSSASLKRDQHNLFARKGSQERVARCPCSRNREGLTGSVMQLARPRKALNVTDNTPLPRERNMEKERTLQKIVLKQRVLILLFASALFLILVTAFNAQPAYAADHQKPSNIVAPQQIIPDPQENPSNRVQGWIWIYGSNCQPVSGINVYLYAINKTNGWPMEAGPVQTWSNGFFYFENGDPRFMDCIAPNQVCYVSVNGCQTTLGSYCDNPAWCQWQGNVTTDDRGYGCFCPIWLSPSAVVNVPAAAMYSNSQYATLRYVMGQTDTFKHTLSFKIGTFGVSDGYMSGTVAERGLTCYPLGKFVVYQQHYASTYCDASHNTYKSGIVAKVPGASWGLWPATEYISNPSGLNVSDCEDFTCAKLGAVDGTFTETNAHTWSANAGVPFGVIFPAFGKEISLDVTVQSYSGTANTLCYRVDMADAITNDILKFRVYRVTGEIHCFEMGVAH
jgi:hypothetical protein